MSGYPITIEIMQYKKCPDCATTLNKTRFMQAVEIYTCPFCCVAFTLEEIDGKQTQIGRMD